jgi:hypothetical protein
MNYGNRIETIYAVAVAPGPMSRRYGLLLALLFSGEDIPEAIVRRGLEEAMAKATERGFHPQNDWWTIRRWFELFAFTATPDSMIDLAAALPADLKHSQNFELVVLTLGSGDADPAFQTLLGLAQEIPGLETTHYYPGALAQIGSIEAANHLISLSFEPDHAKASGPVVVFANALVVLLRKHPLAKDYFLTQVTEKRDALGPVHARALAEIIEEKDVISLLQSCEPSGREGSTGAS